MSLIVLTALSWGKLFTSFVVSSRGTDQKVKLLNMMTLAIETADFVNKWHLAGEILCILLNRQYFQASICLSGDLLKSTWTYSQIPDYIDNAIT